MMQIIKKIAKRHFPKDSRAQTAIEYMLILAVVSGIVFIGLRGWLTQIHDTSGNYFNEVSEGVMGPPAPANLN